MSLHLREDLMRRVDALLWDSYLGRRTYGKRNELVENLLELWVRQQERERGVSADELVKVIAEQGVGDLSKDEVKEQARVADLHLHKNPERKEKENGS